MGSTLVVVMLALSLAPAATVHPGEVPRCAGAETPARPWAGCGAHDREALRRSIRGDDRLFARWTRGWALVGVGTPVAVAGLGLVMVFGYQALVLGDGNHEHRDGYRAGVGGSVGGAVMLAAGLVMLGFGGHDIVQTKRGARRLHVGLSPTPRGAGLQLRF